MVPPLNSEKAGGLKGNTVKLTLMGFLSVAALATVSGEFYPYSPLGNREGRVK